MAKLPTSFTPADRTKNKKLIEKIPIDQLDARLKTIAAAYTSSVFARSPGEFSGVDTKHPETLDPIRFQQHRAAYEKMLKADHEEVFPAVVKLENDLNNLTKNAQQMKAIGKDKKLAAYFKTLHNDATALRVAIASTERTAALDMTKEYKQKLRAAPSYLVLKDSLKTAEQRSAELRSVLDQVKKVGTIENAVNALKGGDGPARRYVTKIIGAWTGPLHAFPELAASVWTGDPQDYKRNTWIDWAGSDDQAAPMQKQLKQMVLKTAGRGREDRERRVVAQMVDEYNKQMDKAEELLDHVREFIKRLDAAAK